MTTYNNHNKATSQPLHSHPTKRKRSMSTSSSDLPINRLMAGQSNNNHKGSSRMMPTRNLGLVLLLLLNWITSVQANCSNIGTNPSWDTFMSSLHDREMGRGVSSRQPFCPFTIEGDQCPEEGNAGYFVQFYLDLSCDDFSGGTGDGCFINCPHARITVTPFAFMDMFSFHLGGSTKQTFLTIGQGADVFGSKMTFTNNGSLDPTIDGGAIKVEPLANLYLEAPVFRGNQAGRGGAIFNEGTVTIDGGELSGNRADYGGAVYTTNSFEIVSSGALLSDNTATVEGGAIHHSGNKLDVRRAIFLRNRASWGGGLFTLTHHITILTNIWQENGAERLGPAVLLAAGSVDTMTRGGNQGCGNEPVESPKHCDGVSTMDMECVEFDEKCTLPTSPPTLSPTLEPTQQPTTQSPTTTPSFSPSQLPSSTPSTSLTPTSAPSLAPSSHPSIAPSSSLSPSAYPSTIPSSTPSIYPSSNPSSLPSSNPSSTPSIIPSSMASSIPSSIPSSMPSLVPSMNPTLEDSESPSWISEQPSWISEQPSLSLQPSESNYPSANPSPKPSLRPTSPPSISGAPSDLPSLSSMPSSSDMPSEAPSSAVSYEPSYSSSPSLRTTSKPSTSVQPSSSSAPSPEDP